MRRRPVRPAVRRAVAGAAGAGALSLLAACGSGGEAASVPGPTPAAAEVVTTTAPATTTPPIAATTTTVVTTTTTPAPPTTTAPATTAAVPTLAPIVTHDARVGVGVLTEVAVNAPVRVVIPSLGSDGIVTPTGVNELGELAVPDDAKELVWWQYGPTPGAPGSAVIAGHLDWKGVLGTFNRLDETPVGEVVTVTYADGAERAFVVTSVELADKPAVAVNGTFARDGEPSLRLVTCGGEFNYDIHRYRSNVIVTAVPV